MDQAEPLTIAPEPADPPPSPRWPSVDPRTVVEIVLSVGVILVSGWYLLQAIRELSSQSLWQDELYSIFEYSGRGPGRTVTTYDAANNHILFNLLNSLTPGAGSTDPARARLWAIASTVALPVVGGAELARRRWYLAGALFFAVFASSTEWLRLALQARGYSILGLAVVVLAIAAWRYLEQPRRRWLAVMGVASFVGCFTMPSFALFVAPLWLILFALRRRRAIVVAVAITGVATMAAYAAVAGQLIDEYTGYKDRFGVQFRSSDVFGSIHTYLMTETHSVLIWALWLLGAAAATLVLIGRPKILVQSMTDMARLLLLATGAFFAICVVMATSPPRTTSFAAVVLGLVVLASVGAVAGQIGSRTLQMGALALLVVAALVGSFSIVRQPVPETWLPVEDWKGAAAYIEATFPTGTTVYVAPPRPWENLDTYLDDDYPVVNTFDAAAFTEGRLVIVSFEAGTRGNVFNSDDLPGAPVPETRLRQERGRTPPHVLRILYAPFPGGRPAEVQVSGRPQPALSDVDPSTTVDVPNEVPEDGYRLTISTGPGSPPTRSMAIAIAAGKLGKVLQVTANGPDGSVVLPASAVTRSANVITVALGDRRLDQVIVDFSRKPGTDAVLSDIWFYPPTID